MSVSSCFIHLPMSFRWPLYSWLRACQLPHPRSPTERPRSWIPGATSETTLSWAQEHSKGATVAYNCPFHILSYGHLHMTLMYFIQITPFACQVLGSLMLSVFFYCFKCNRLQPCLLYDNFHTCTGPHLVSYEPKSAKGNIPKVPSLKLTKPMKIGLPKRKLIFQPSIFRCYVSFREGNQFFQIRESRYSCQMGLIMLKKQTSDVCRRDIYLHIHEISGPSHNHGSEKWVPPIVVSFHLG